MCIDYRALNKIINQEYFQMPLPWEIFINLKNKKYFPKIDLSSTYHQIRIAKGCEKYTAFNTPFSNNEFKVMPFGLSTAPAIFQKAITNCLFKVLREEVAVFLDNIKIACEEKRKVHKINKNCRE
jgi:Reverse transcriptase (RNA-dependent DNA polymerase)